MTTSIFVSEILTPDKCYEDAILVVEDGVIRDVRPDIGPVPGEVSASFPSCVAVPGFVDVHVHGYEGYGANTDDPTEFAQLAETVCRHGVTTVFPTTMAGTKESTLEACSAFAAVDHNRVDGAVLEGLHLEGPHLSPAQSGAQDEDVLRPPDIDELQRCLDRADGAIDRITVAPELNGALEFAQTAREAGITVSAGHSDASYEEAMTAFDGPVSAVTHLYNGMSGGHHRRPGLTGAGLTRDDVAVELIADFHHLHEATVQTAVRAKPMEKVLLVTDAVPPAGLPNERHELDGRPVVVRDGACRLAETETLAGSTLTMDRAVANVVKTVGVDLSTAVRFASTNPAVEQGLTDRGRIEPGRRADLAILDDERLDVVATIVGGEVMYRRPPSAN